MENHNLTQQFVASLIFDSGEYFDQEQFHRFVIGRYYFDASLLNCRTGKAKIQFDDKSMVDVVVSGPGSHPHWRRYFVEVPGMNERARRARYGTQEQAIWP